MMGRNHSIAALAAAALVAVTVPLAAHHSTTAEFDTNKPIKFTGTVKAVEWMNPHIYTQIEVKDNGKTLVYRVEGGPPNSLFRQGWRKDSLKIGETVTVSGIRAKSETSMNIGSAVITTADGRRMFGAGGRGGAADQAAPTPQQ